MRLTLSDMIARDAEDGAGSGADTVPPIDPTKELYPDKKEDTPAAGDDTTPAGDDTVKAADDTPPAGGDDTTGGGEDTAKGGEDTGPAVPEKYELAMPEGMEVDQGLLDAVTPIAKELKLDNAAMQKFADVYAKTEMERAENWRKTREGWVESAKKDPKIGGQKWAETVDFSNRALAEGMRATGRYGVREILNDTGAGCHPDLIAIFDYFGRKFADDEPVRAQPAGGPKKTETPIEVLYGKT